jgi:hypothetical protein
VRFAVLALDNKDVLMRKSQWLARAAVFALFGSSISFAEDNSRFVKPDADVSTGVSSSILMPNDSVTPAAGEEDDAPEYEVANRMEMNEANNAEMLNEYEATDPAAKPAPKPKKPKKPPQPWKPVFYDNDFSYINDPNHTPLFGENMKRICVGDCDTLDYGGEMRFRYMDDHNRFRPAPGQYPVRNDYGLWRWRQYINYDTSNYRVYIEGIDASVTGNSLPPTGIDKDRWDLLNAFVDVKTDAWTDQPSALRVGRQELLYGSQRLISPLDWANTRRTFEGVKWYTKSKTYDFDMFAVRPILINPTAFDGELGTRTFMGAWLTDHSDPDHTLDYYWLYNHDNGTNVGRTNAFSRHTVGSRWLGRDPHKNAAGDEICALLWDFEGGYQFGRDSNRDVSAGFLTAGLGHTWTAATWKPTLWAFFDYASGDRNPNDNQNNTFSQLYPLGHLYLGFFDGVARQNIIDYNFKASVNPHKKLELLAWMHFFSLDQPRDAFYEVTGKPFATNPAGSNRTNVGSELDLLATYTYNQNWSTLVGYSWFWNGPMLEQASTPRLANGEFLYVQTQLRY